MVKIFEGGCFGIDWDWKKKKEREQDPHDQEG
jgi:hypothetical protein